MRSSTKLKRLLKENTITITVNDKNQFEAIVKSNKSGDCFLVTNTAFSALITEAVSSAKFLN